MPWQLENAQLLYRYARFDRARPRLLRILAVSCDDELGAEAAATLDAMDGPGACERAQAARCDGSITAPVCVAATSPSD